MKNSSLISLLQALTAEEFKIFGDFVHSPIYNTNKKCLQFYELLKRTYPNFEEKAVDKEQIGIKLFGNKEKATKNMAFLMTTMSNLVQEFLIFLQLEKNKDVHNTLLLQSLSEKSLKRHFIDKYKQVMGDLEQQSAQSSVSYFGDRYEKLTLLQEFNELNKDNTLSIDLQDVADTFYKHSLLQQLRIAAIIINKASIQAIQYDRDKLNELLATAEKKQFLSETAIELYYRTLKLLLDNLDNKPDTNNDFEWLKKTLVSATNSVTPDELRNLYTYAHSYCNRQVQKGKEEFRKEAFYLYKQQLAQNFLEINGYILPGNIRNIVTLGLQCSETVWVRGFIEEVKDKTMPKFRDDLYAFNLGSFCFFTKDYKGCLANLNSIIEFIAPIYEIEAKNLLLKSYYELDERLVFDSLVDSYRGYVRYQKTVTPQRKEAYLNFIGFVNKLHKCRLLKGFDKVKVAKLVVEINNCNNISDKKWLLEKIAET